MPRFLTDLLRLGRARLDREQGKHAARVLRMRPGDEIILFDGTGREGSATIVEIQGVQVDVEIHEMREGCRESRLATTLASALPKGKRAGILVEKAAELGAAAFWPTLFARSSFKPRETAIERLRRIATSASKQSGRAALMEIAPAATISERLDEARSFDRVFLADPEAPEGFPRLNDLRNCLVIVGPEGGLTLEEKDAILHAGAHPVRLAAATLRIETAVLAAAAILGTSTPR